MNASDNTPFLGFAGQFLLPQAGSRRFFFWVFFVVALGLGSLCFIALSYANHNAKQRLSSTLASEEARAVEAMQGQVEEALFHLSSDLLLVKQQIERSLTGTLSTAELSGVLRDFAASHRIYKQVRYVGTDGKEIIRVNNDDGATVLVPQDQLQDKSTSAYLNAAQTLKAGGFLITPLDANREFGVVQTPVVPIFRVLTPIFADGTRRGVAIINYDAGYLLSNIAAIGSAALGKPLVIGADGRSALADFESGDSASIAFDGNAQHSFAKEYPKAWAKMQATPSGVVSDGAGGLVTYSRFRPEKLYAQKRFNDELTWELSAGGDDATRGTWFLASHVDLATQASIESIANDRSHLLESLFALLVIAFAWVLALGASVLRQRARELKSLATLDYLTKALNRGEFERRLDSALSHAQRFNRPMGVLYIDLNKFKEVNDTLGHAAGDDLLVHVANTLARSVRKSDAVGRIGGDEFAIVLRETRSRDDIQVVVDFIKEKLASPVIIRGKRVVSGGSIGFASYPEDGDSATALTEAADKGMYSDKNHNTDARRAS